MSDQEASEQQAAKQRLAERSKQTGTCPEWRVFRLGSNGTAMVSCGLPLNHEKEEASETDEDEDEDVLVLFHMTRQEFDDGSAVTFRWPL